MFLLFRNPFGKVNEFGTAEKITPLEGERNKQVYGGGSGGECCEAEMKLSEICSRPANMELINLIC